MSAPVYRPKRLAWEKHHARPFFWTNTIFGPLEIRRRDFDESIASHWTLYRGRNDAKFDTAEAAQAAAQAWFDARMIEGLEEVKDA